MNALRRFWRTLKEELMAEPEYLTTTEGRPTKVIISVTAGLVPGQSMKEFGRQWTLDAEEADTPETYLAAQGAAVAYTMYLHNPQIVNWVRLDWIWL